MGFVGRAAVLAAVAVVARVGYTAVFVPRFEVHESGGVVVTGASSGIGEHAAAALAAAGYTVFAGVRKEKDGARLKAAYPGVRPVVLDVTNTESIRSAVAQVEAELTTAGTTLVALVNNAGVQKDMPVELQANRFNFDVNVFGLFDVTRAFLPLLRKTGAGARIVNTGSLAGILAAPGSASYSASKFAVEGFSDALRMELIDLGISVSLLQPGYVRSQMGAKAHVASAESYGVATDEYDRYRRTVFEGFYAKDKMLSSSQLAEPPAETTTPAILDAIQSATPRTRYPVAHVDVFPAWVLVIIKTAVPDRVMDFLTLEV